MMQSDQINELAAALAKAQGAMTVAVFDRQNPHFRNKYASLASTLDAIRKPLADNGLSITQTMHMAEGSLVLVTILRHASGQWINSIYPLPLAAKPQELGSALTYARRYSVAAIVSIAADDDDDAEDARKQGQVASAPKTLPKKDAKATYERLQSEIRAIEAMDALRQWGEENRERIELLPGDWQDILRMKFHERLVELRQLGANDKMVVSSTTAMAAGRDAALDWLDKAASKYTTMDAFSPWWNDHVSPRTDGWPQEDQDEAIAIFRKHEARIAGDAS